MTRRPSLGRERDAWVLGGWTALVLAGQLLLPVACPPLEAFAVAWLWVGVWSVSRGSCLPLLVLGYPAFLCENHRPWAWALPVLVALLLLRILVENRLGRRQLLLLALVGSVALAASWPAGAVDLLGDLARFPASARLAQWLAPDAAWAIFPFRQTADRVLLAVTCAAAAMAGRYVVTGRLGRAYWLAALLLLVSAHGAALVPWQEPHLFLGTSNYASYDGRLFHGAGHNVTYLVIGLGVGLPWFVLAAGRVARRPLRRLSLLLALPALLIHQRAFWLAVGALLLAGLPAAAMRLRRCRRRRAARTVPAAWRRRAVALAALCVLVPALWFLLMGLFVPGSLLRFQLRNRAQTLLTLRMQDEALRTGGAVAPWDTTLAAELVRDIELPPARRLGAWLTRWDRARGAMWVVGVREIAASHFWRGSGAGTWARFHRLQPRPSRTYAAHMHNTYLDLFFEYGVVPGCLLLLGAAIAARRLAFAPPRLQRPWVFPLLAAAVLGLGQHLFHAFSTACLMLPLLVLLAGAARRR